MTAEQRAGLSDAALAMTQPCIDELIKDISRRVQKAGAITDTAEYQLYRAQALGESKKAIEQAVSKQIGISEEVIASLFEYVADKSLSLDENGSLKRMTEAYTRMTQSKTRELLRDLWADTPEGKAQPLQTAYARAMDFAFRQVATGTLDLNTAIRRAVTPLAKRGLRTIEQKSGRSVGIEYACRRYIMDQLGQLDDEIQRADHDALGCDGWEISAHAACAPDHERETAELYKNKEFPCRRALGSCACGCRGRRTGCRSGTLYWKEVWRMSELEQVIAWLRTYEGHDILKDWHVDYTDQVPSCGAVFPQGLQEIERRTYITGAVCVTNQSNFGLYFTFAKSAGDDEGAKINADWVNDFQHWVQEQSAHGLAPNFGDAEEPVIARAQNGVLYEAEAEGTATYMVVLSLRYTKTYESEDFA